jgi:DNA-directed RNA polymerase specialized sigma24 family protein
MSSSGSVTHWIGLLRAGDHAAAQPLWERYFQQLVALARTRLLGASRRAADEEDVALSAFDSFCRGAERCRFPQLGDREELWRLLVVITARKALRTVRHERCQKRGGGKVYDEAALSGPDPLLSDPALAQFMGNEPTPDFAAQVAEECGRLLGRLGEGELRSIALWKMEGYTTEEMADRLRCAPRTIERKLRVIRRLWKQEGTP